MRPTAAIAFNLPVLEHGNDLFMLLQLVGDMSTGPMRLIGLQNYREMRPIPVVVSRQHPDQ